MQQTRSFKALYNLMKLLIGNLSSIQPLSLSTIFVIKGAFSIAILNQIVENVLFVIVFLKKYDLKT